MHRRLKQLIAACSGAALLVGCAHTIRIKIVDATTREPLEGVSTRWLQARHQMFQQLKQEGPTNLPPSRQDGTIVVGGLHTWWSSDLIFSCPGYSNVYGQYGSGILCLARRMRYFPPGPLQEQFILEGGVRVAEKSSGCFVVEMQK